MTGETSIYSPNRHNWVQSSGQYFPVGTVVCSQLTPCHLVCRMVSGGMKMTRLSHCWSAVDILSETISCFKENQCLCDSVPCNTVSLCSGFIVIYYHVDRRIS